MTKANLPSERKVRPGARLRLTVSGVSPEGVGIARYHGRPVYVRGALPGDVVEARVEKRERGRIEARVEQVVTQEIQRIVPKCEHFSVCGGCLWQNLEYVDQLALKKQIVQSCFRQAGVPEVEVADVMGSEEIFFYRNKMDFSFGQHVSGELMLGLFVEDGADEAEHRLSRERAQMPAVFDVETCLLQSEASNQVVRTARETLKQTGMRAYNPENRSGMLRSLVVREAKRTGQMLVHLVAARTSHGAPLKDALVHEMPQIQGVVVSANRTRSKNAPSSAREVLVGQERIREQILGLDVAVSATSFSQVNTLQAERLYELALSMAELQGGEQVLDLYCGTVSLLLAKQAESVTGVESLPEAVEDALENASQNTILNCEFICGDVLEVLPELGRSRAFDVITVNPPRAGIYRAVVQEICGRKPKKIIYISCNPQTLGRDLAEFQRGGYRIDRVQPVDMFPHTPHCEVVVALSREEDHLS